MEVGINGREIFAHAINGEIIATDDLTETGDQAETAEFLKLQPLATISIAVTAP